MKAYLQGLIFLVIFMLIRSTYGQDLAPVEKVKNQEELRYSGSSLVVKTINEVSAIYDSVYYYHCENGSELALSARDTDIEYADSLLMGYINQIYDSGEWINATRYSYAYDTEKRPLRFAIDMWNGGMFEEFSRISWGYDTNGNNNLYLQESMIDGQWTVNVRNDKVFGENNEILEETVFSYGNFIKWLYIYLPDWRLDSTLAYSMVEDQWVPDYIINHEYDANLNLVNDTIVSWNGVEWKPSVLTTYTYDESRNLITEVTGYYADLMLILDTYDSTWYDEQNRKIGNLRRAWNENEWENAQLNEFSYDAYNNLLTEDGYEWNSPSWVPSYKYSNTYRANILESQRWLDYDFYNPENFTYDSAWYYFDLGVHVVDVNSNKSNIKVYPNPASDKVTIVSDEEIRAVKLFTLQGLIIKEISKNQLKGKQAIIDISDQQAGTYIIEVTARHNKRTFKILRR